MSTTVESRISLIPGGEGHQVQVLTDLTCRKVGAEQTGGAYSVFKVTVPPGGGPPLHRHPPAETIYVLEGEFAVLCSGGELVAHTGDTVHIPAAEPHGYRNLGEGMGQILAIIQPSGMDAFFDELGVPADGQSEPQPLAGPPDIERLMAITAKHGVEML